MTHRSWQVKQIRIGLDIRGRVRARRNTNLGYIFRIHIFNAAPPVLVFSVTLCSCPVFTQSTLGSTSRFPPPSSPAPRFAQGTTLVSNGKSLSVFDPKLQFNPRYGEHVCKRPPYPAFVVSRRTSLGLMPSSGCCLVCFLLAPGAAAGSLLKFDFRVCCARVCVRMREGNTVCFLRCSR